MGRLILGLIGTNFPSNLVSSNEMRIKMPNRTYQSWYIRNLDLYRSLVGKNILLDMFRLPMNYHIMDTPTHLLL